MKTIKTLQILINILYYLLIGVAGITTLYFLVLFIYPEVLPFFLQTWGMAFKMFDWKLLVGPVLSSVNFLLFIYGIYLLKKTIPSFKRSEFYEVVVEKNLKKAGQIFIFIGISTTLLKMIFLLIIQSTIGFMQSFWMVLNSLISSIDLAMISLIIIGLFLLLFSDSFKNARVLQEENDLTI